MNQVPQDEDMKNCQAYQMIKEGQANPIDRQTGSMEQSKEVPTTERNGIFFCAKQRDNSCTNSGTKDSKEEELSKQVTKAQDQVSVLMENNKQLEAKLTGLRKENNKLAHTIEVLNDSKNDELAKAATKIELEIKKLKESRKECEQRKKEQQTLSQENKELQKELISAKKTCNRINHENGKQTANQTSQTEKVITKDAKVECNKGIEPQAKEHLIKVELQNCRNGKQEGEGLCIMEQNRNLYNKIGELNLQIVSLMEENGTLTREIEKLHASKIEIMTRTEASTKASEQELECTGQKESKQQEDKIKELEQTIAQLQSQIVEYNREQTTFKAESEKLKALMLDSFTNSRENRRITELEGIIQEQQKKIEEHDSTTKQFYKLYDRANQGAEENKRMIILSLERVKLLQDQNSKLDQVNKSTQEENNCIKKELDSTKEKIEHLLQQNKELTEKIFQLKDTIVQKYAVINELQATIAEQQKGIEERDQCKKLWVERLKQLQEQNNELHRVADSTQETDENELKRKLKEVRPLLQKEREMNNQNQEELQLEEEEKEEIILQGKTELVRDYKKRIVTFCKKNYPKATKQQKEDQLVTWFIEGIYDVDLRLELQEQDIENIKSAVEIAEEWEILQNQNASEGETNEDIEEDMNKGMNHLNQEQIKDIEIKQGRYETIQYYKKCVVKYCKKKYPKATQQQQKHQQVALFIKGIYNRDLKRELQEQEVGNIEDAAKIAKEWEILNDASDTELEEYAPLSEQERKKIDASFRWLNQL